MKIAVLSNVNMNILIKKLKRSIDAYEAQGYGNYLEELLNEKSGLHEYDPDYIFILMDGQSMIMEKEEVLSMEHQLIEVAEAYLKKNNKTKIWISSIDLYDRIAEYSQLCRHRIVESKWLNNILEKNNRNLHIFDTGELIQKIGREEFYSESLNYLSSTPYSNKGIGLIKDKIIAVIDSLQKARKKCLLLDMDNTLWGGVLGEEGPNGIQCAPAGEGKVYYDFQQKIKQIKDMGVILVACSKNNRSDVEELFRVNKQLFLHQEDFTIIKANWNRKADNVVEVAKELNIGFDAMVFVDDNPGERENMKIELPEVEVPDFPQVVYELPAFADRLYEDYFFAFSLTQEDKQKAKQYEEEKQRITAKSQFINYEEYLKSLNMDIDIREVAEDDLERAAQLTQKTNQFNLTTRRYTQTDLIEMKKKDRFRIIIVSVKDRFGNYGKVALVIVRIEQKEWDIDTFLMSCRVMGKDIEREIIRVIEEEAQKNNIKILKGTFIKSKKNKPVENFFSDMGFEIIDKTDDEIRYQKKIGD